MCLHEEHNEVYAYGKCTLKHRPLFLDTFPGNAKQQNKTPLALSQTLSAASLFAQGLTLGQTGLSTSTADLPDSWPCRRAEPHWKADMMRPVT